MGRAANDNAPSMWWRTRRYVVRSAAAGAVGALIWSIVSN